MTKRSISKPPPDTDRIPGMDYLLELTRELVGQTPIGQEWPEVVRVRPPNNPAEVYILERWRDIIAKDRGAPLPVIHPTLH